MINGLPPMLTDATPAPVEGAAAAGSANGHAATSPADAADAPPTGPQGPFAALLALLTGAAGSTGEPAAGAGSARAASTSRAPGRPATPLADAGMAIEVRADEAELGEEPTGVPVVAISAASPPLTEARLFGLSLPIARVPTDPHASMDGAVVADGDAAALLAEPPESVAGTQGSTFATADTGVFRRTAPPGGIDAGRLTGPTPQSGPVAEPLPVVGARVDPGAADSAAEPTPMQVLPPLLTDRPGETTAPARHREAFLLPESVIAARAGLSQSEETADPAELANRPISPVTSESTDPDVAHTALDGRRPRPMEAGAARADGRLPAAALLRGALTTDATMPESNAPVPADLRSAAMPISALDAVVDSAQFEPATPTSANAATAATAPATVAVASTPTPTVALASTGTTDAPLVSPSAFSSLVANETGDLLDNGLGQRRVVLHLDPPELGGVTIELIARGEDLSVAARTENAEATRALLRQRLDIVAAISAHGMSLAGFDVSDGQTPGDQQREEAARSTKPRTSPDTAATVDLDQLGEDRPTREGAIFL